MHWLIDIFIVVCLVWGIWKGFRRGFVMQIFAVGSFLVGFWAGFSLSSLVEPYIEPHIGKAACSFVAFLIVFAAVLIAMFLIGKLVTKLLDVIALGMINRLLGAIFGFVANVLILSVLIYFVNRFDSHFKFIPQNEVQKCLFYEPVSKVAPAIFPERFKM